MWCTAYNLGVRRTVCKVSEPRARGRRAGLNREAVLAAARTLLEERGLDALSMRALAARLEVAPNALYSHVASKAELVDAVLDDVLGEVRRVHSGGGTVDPVRGLRALLTATYEVLLAHPDLVPLYLARQGARGDNAQRLGAEMTDLLARADVRDAAARDALHVLVVFTIGFAAVGARPVGEREPGQRPLADDDVRAAFATGLDWLLAGILAGP